MWSILQTLGMGAGRGMSFLVEYVRRVGEIQVVQWAAWSLHLSTKSRAAWYASREGVSD